MDADQYGPAMLELTEKQRKFVLAMAADPLGNATKWARTAGYSQESQGSIRVAGCKVLHDEKVQAAAREVAAAHLNLFGPILASTGLLRIAKNPKHKDHTRALEMIANRVGLHETTEHRVTVDDKRPSTDAARIARITELAGELGVDIAKLLGGNVSRPMKVIEQSTRQSEDVPLSSTDEVQSMPEGK